MSELIDHEPVTKCNRKTIMLNISVTQKAISTGILFICLLHTKHMRVL